MYMILGMLIAVVGLIDTNYVESQRTSTPLLIDCSTNRRVLRLKLK